MRASPSVVGLTVALLVASCAKDRTAIVVEFALVGHAADQGGQLEVLLACDPSDGTQELMEYDLSLLGSGDTPSLGLEPGTPRCDIYLAAQLRGEDAFPLASADVRLHFEDGEVQTVTLTLDTDQCVDIDGDEAVSGAGCDSSNDCDELNPTISTGATEMCNSHDDDCDGVVDDLSDAALERACSNEPVPWRPDVGLCRYWRPICQDGALICPDLDVNDDCRLQMDTNCDGKLTGCGCTPQMLETYDDCEPCSVPRCDGDVIECVQADPNTLIGSCCVEDGLPGIFVCDPTLEAVVCLQGETRPEVCNDESRIDEDCDGLTNSDDPDCQLFVDIEVTCPVVELPPASTPNFEVPQGCDEPRYQAYDAAACTIREEITGLVDHGVFVILYIDPFVSFTPPVVQSCCNCHVDMFILWDVAVFRVTGEDSRGRIYVEGDELIFSFDAWIADWAVYEDLEVTVGIRRRDMITSDENGIECVSNCYEDVQSAGGMGNE